jgi:hypothetical protein
MSSLTPQMNLRLLVFRHEFLHFFYIFLGVHFWPAWIRIPLTQLNLDSIQIRIRNRHCVYFSLHFFYSLFGLFIYFIQHCLICCTADLTHSEDAWIELRIVAEPAFMGRCNG